MRYPVQTGCTGAIDNSFQLEIEHRMSKILGINATELLNQRSPLRRHGPANEIAQTVPFLASDMSGFSTEEVFIADGGMAGQQRAFCANAHIDLGIAR